MATTDPSRERAQHDAPPRFVTATSTKLRIRVRPGWVFLKDLQLPPDLVRRLDERFPRRWFGWGKWARDAVEEDLKMQHFYGGKAVAYLLTTEGGVVVAAADDFDSPEFRASMDDLSRQEWCSMSRFVPFIWNDSVSRL